MSFFEKLLLSKQLSFNLGDIELLDQRLVIVSSEAFANYIYSINDSNELAVSNLYQIAKKAMIQLGINIGKKYSFSFGDYSTWFVEIARLNGWGKAKWELLDKKNFKGIISIEDSPISTALKNKVKNPCDHIIRGLIAGGATSSFKMDVEVIETECIAQGKEKCIFVIDTDSNLKSQFPDLYTKQLVYRRLG